MQTLITIVHILTCLFLILVVLLQAGRGGGLGAGLSGASAQVFGGQGAAPFLVKVTSVLAAIFFCTSLVLSGMSTANKSVVLQEKDNTPKATVEEVTPKAGEEGADKAADESGDADEGNDESDEANDESDEPKKTPETEQAPTNAAPAPMPADGAKKAE